VFRFPVLLHFAISLFLNAVDDLTVEDNAGINRGYVGQTLEIWQHWKKEQRINPAPGAVNRDIK